MTSFFLKTKAFFKFYIELAIDNKINLIFTLLFPIIYQLFSTNITHVLTDIEFIQKSIPMIAYIIVATALNGVTMSIIATRNNGFIKAYFYASGSKWAIYVANLLVQLVIVILENFIFTLSLMILYKYISIRLLISILLMTIISFPIISLGFNILFLIRIRQSSLSVFSTSLLLGFLILFNITKNSTTIFSDINPYTFIELILSNIINPNLIIMAQSIVVAILYTFIGIIGYNFLDLQDRGKE
ncbi:hypothetical protein [Lactobacillus sp.]|uniref:hypothetical protein n=1 Tax=Lactobacillus sp. TaxID=1591 RepID=UPI0019AA9D1A|nr:hypothetical protein [Lactobacillus sp.]MBD5429512.1 hypothetical protein [Lactobacillus sp.]